MDNDYKPTPFTTVLVVNTKSSVQTLENRWSVSDAESKNILKFFEHKTGEKDDNLIASVIEKLTPMANASNIAVDECDLGTSLGLGIDLFCKGHKELHMLIQ